METSDGRIPGVVCLQPPVYDFALYDLFLKPYGLQQIAAWFRQGGWSVHMVDALDWRDTEAAALLGRPKRKANGTGKFFRQPAALPPGIKPLPRRYSRYGLPQEILRRKLTRIPAEAVQVVCITTGMTYWYPGVAEATALARTLFPEAALVLGGIYATLLPEHALKSSGADLAVKGENPEPLRKLLAERGLPVPPGEVPRYPDPDLAGTPGDGKPGGSYESAVIRLNRGCPLSCDYCASGILNPGFASGDFREAFDYTRTLYRRYGIRSFAFYDDALLFGREQVLLPYLEQVIAAGLETAFYTPNAVHITGIDRETARLMRKAGFREVRMGYESSSSDFHRLHDRKFLPDQFERALGFLREAGFSPRELPVYVLAGLPGQRYEEAEASVTAAVSAGAAVSIAEFSPVPGTALWEKAAADSPLPLADEPLYQNNSYFPMAWEGFTREDLRRLKEKARNTREIH